MEYHLPVARKVTEVHITLLAIFHVSIHLITKLFPTHKRTNSRQLRLVRKISPRCWIQLQYLKELITPRSSLFLQH